MAPLRVAFAGLAHSHPFADAENLERHASRGEGIEFVGVHDGDEDLSAQFARRFPCPIVASLHELAERQPDLVIATPRPWEVTHFARALLDQTTAPVFFNKVVAATESQLAAWQQATAGAPERVGTASVLRFAPTLVNLTERIDPADVRSICVLVQHDTEPFLAPDRAWQDDPESGGGTLVTVGIHAWEIIGRVLPDATLDDHVTGWIQRSPDARTRSEETAQASVTLRLPDGGRVPCSVFVSGSRGPETYSLDVFTASGSYSIRLSSQDPTRSLGYAELIEHLIRDARKGRVAAPWTSAEPIVINTIRAAQELRVNPDTEKSQRNVL